MITIVVLGKEYYDEQNQEFVYPDSYTLEFSHSLVSLSKWESKHKKPFLGEDEKTRDEILDYIYMMLNAPNKHPDMLNELSQENVDEISEYIHDNHTATWFAKKKKASGPTQIVTAELIYYWMIAYGIPAEYQHWHLNRLLTLIRVCQEHNQPEKKTSQAELAQRQREINRARHAELEAKRKAIK